MDSKFSLNEVDDFIRKFRNKNKNMKNSSLIKQNECEKEAQRKIEQTETIVPTKNLQSKSKTFVDKGNESNNIFLNNGQDNDEVTDIFQKKEQKSGANYQSQPQTIQSKPKSNLVNLNQMNKESNDKQTTIDNKDNQLNPNDTSNKEVVNQVQANIPSIKQPLEIIEESESNYLNKNMNENGNGNINLSIEKEITNKPSQVSNKPVSKIIVNNNPFADEPDHDPSTLFQIKEEIPSQAYVPPIKPKKKILIPNQKHKAPDKEVSNEFLFEEKQETQPNTITNDTNNSKIKESEDSFKSERTISEEPQKPNIDVKFPQFKDKTNPNPQYAKKLVYNSQKQIKPQDQSSQVQISNDSHYNNDKDNKTPMKSIYSGFTSELNAKTKVFESDELNKQIERLDDDINDSKQDFRFRTNSIDYPNNKNDTPGYQIDNDRQMLSSSYSNSQISLTTISKGNIVSTSKSKLLITSISSLLFDQERELYMNYAPISYSEQFNFSKIISYLETLQSITSKSNISSSIAIYLELLLLKHKMKLSSCNLFSESNLAVRTELIQMIKASMNHASYTKGFFDFNLSISQDDYQESSFSYNNSSLTLNHMMDYCHSINSMASFALLSIISNQEGINDYLLSLFDKGIINKNSYWYLLIIIKSGQIDKLLEEDSAVLFDNFAYFILLLLENFTVIPSANINKAINSILKSNDSRLTYLNYIILFFLRNSFRIEQEDLHGELITAFLNMANIQKIILSDVFNYFCYCLNENLPMVIAKSSILIKFKYTLIKLYDNDSSVIALGKKISENYVQFGRIGKNKYFKEYLSNSYVNNSEVNEEKKTDDKEYNNDRLNQKVSNDENDNDSSNLKKEETVINKPSFPTQTPIADSSSNSNSNTTNNAGGSIIMSLFSSIGLGFSQKQNTDNQKQELKTYTEEELSQMPPEVRWKIEHPNEEEIYYDSVLKRYVLRGKIYDDQEEVIQKKEKEKPFVPPPKYNKAKVNQSNGNTNKDQSKSQEFVVNHTSQTQTQSQSQPPAISNPFNASRVLKQNVTKNQSKQKELNNRYVVGYHQ